MLNNNVKKETIVFNQPESWDYETDVIVIGTGTSMYGASKMAEAGLDVIAIDAYSFAGGATGFSGGVAYIPMNKYAVENGDTKEETMKYLKALNEDTPTPEENIEAYIDNANPMLEYMTDVFAEQGLYPQAQGAKGFGDYHAEVEGGRADGWRSISWVPESGEIDIYDVTAWRDAYIQGFKDRGGQIMTSTKATKYVYSYKDDGVPKIYGIIAEQDGKEIALKANRAVLTATGGFEWNEEMRKSFLPVDIPYACSLNTNDGTGLRMTMELGADLTNMAQSYGMVTFKEKAQEQKEQGLPANIVFERYFPRQIIVNKDGRRFMNESMSYHKANTKFFERESHDQYGFSNLPAWQIFDRTFVDEIGMGYSTFTGELNEDGVFPYAKKADTLEELAEIIGVAPQGLMEEVERWNEFCEKGKDADFHRGEDHVDQTFNRMRDMELPFENNLGPLENGPFYAIELAPNTLGTCGGPKVNTKAQVLHISGQPIEGLYACGNFTGFGGPGRSYPGAGGTIGAGQVYGFIAANAIIENEDSSEATEDKSAIAVKKTETAVSDKPDEIELGDNEYVGTSDSGMGGTLEVVVRVEEDNIKDIRVAKDNETKGFGDDAMEKLKKAILEGNRADVDNISGATATSIAYKEAVQNALNKVKEEQLNA